MVVVMLYFGVAWSEHEVNLPKLEITDIFIWCFFLFVFLAWSEGPINNKYTLRNMRLALCGHLLSDLGNEQWKIKNLAMDALTNILLCIHTAR